MLCLWLTDQSSTLVATYPPFCVRSHVPGQNSCLFRVLSHPVLSRAVLNGKNGLILRQRGSPRRVQLRHE